MMRLKASLHARLSSRTLGGRSGRSRNSRSPSSRDTVNQFQQSCSRVPLHAQCCHFEQAVMPLFCACECLIVRGRDGLGYAVEQYSREGVGEGEQRLLRITKFPEFAADSVKTRGYTLFSLPVDQSLTVQFLLNRSSDESANARMSVPPRGFLNLAIKGFGYTHSYNSPSFLSHASKALKTDIQDRVRQVSNKNGGL
jgi:hypothetical protein